MIREPVQILLDRIKQFPEEFVSDNQRHSAVESNRWQRIVSRYKPHFNRHELQTFEALISDAFLRTMKQDIVETLMEVPDITEDINEQKLKDSMRQIAELREARESLHQQKPTKMFVNQGLLDDMKEQILKGKL